MKRIILRVSLVVLLLTIMVLPVLSTTSVYAAPADAYWVGGSGNISDATNHWALISGGAPGAGNLPDATTDTHINADSGASPVITVDGAFNCKGMDFTGAITPTLAGSADLNIAGNFVAIPSLIKNYSGGLKFISTTGAKTITFGGTWGCTVLFEGILGAWTFQDALNIGAGDIYFLSSNITTANFPITAHGFVTQGASLKILDLGSSIVTLSSVWDTSINTGLTILPNTSSIETGQYFYGGNITTYNEVRITGGLGNVITGNNTMASLVLDPTIPQAISFTDGTTQTITGGTLSGSLGNIHTLEGSGAAGWAITKAGGGSIIANYISTTNSTASPASTWYYNTATSTAASSPGWNALTVSTSAATDIGMGVFSFATLNGVATNLNGSNIQVRFNWGYDTGYGHFTALQNGHASSAYTDQIIGFDPNRTVHFRTEVTNGTTTVYGSDQSFSVSGSAPSDPSYVAYNFANSAVPVLFVAFIIFVVMMLAIGGIVPPIMALILMAVSILVGMAFLQGIQALLNAMWGG